MQMKKVIEVIKAHFARIASGDCSKSEVTLTGLCMLLIGIILGMKVAPARASAFGCFNGNSGSIEKPEDIKKVTKDK